MVLWCIRVIHHEHAHLCATDSMHVFSQMSSLARYTWDDSVIASTGSEAGMGLTATGFIDVAPATECKDFSCLNFLSGSFLTFPNQNFGQQLALSFSFWFRPSQAAGEGSTILDLGGGVDQNNIIISRDGASNAMLFSVYVTGESSVVRTQVKSISGMWIPGAWRHIVWIVSREAAASQKGIWRIYFDGVLTTSAYGLYPANAVLNSSFIGKGNAASNTGFVGHMDSFYIFSFALNANEILSLYLVRQPRGSFYTKVFLSSFCFSSVVSHIWKHVCFAAAFVYYAHTRFPCSRLLTVKSWLQRNVHTFLYDVLDSPHPCMWMFAYTRGFKAHPRQLSHSIHPLLG
jgi:hypothetical protein